MNCNFELALNIENTELPVGVIQMEILNNEKWPTTTWSTLHSNMVFGVSSREIN